MAEQFLSLRPLNQPQSQVLHSWRAAQLRPGVVVSSIVLLPNFHIAVRRRVLRQRPELLFIQEDRVNDQLTSLVQIHALFRRAEVLLAGRSILRRR
jgi:hypothetical protein